MTTEEKNQILQLHRQEKKGLREIARIFNVKASSIQNIVAKEAVVRFDRCLNCGREIVIYRRKGQPRKFCTCACKRAFYKKNSTLRKGIYFCECCGKEFHQYKYLKRRFCSRDCANKSHHGIK